MPACPPLRGPLRGGGCLLRARFLPPHVEDARPFAAVVSERDPPRTLAESSDSSPGRLQLRLPKPGFPGRRPLVTICGTLGILLRNHSAACGVNYSTVNAKRPHVYFGNHFLFPNILSPKMSTG